MDVLGQILAWSEERPDWQRDALRRLVLTGDLEDEDIDELTEICKSVHGLAEAQKKAPLLREHIPANGPGAGQVTVLSIFHHQGVNALAEDQTLKFGPSLTVVYGDNAAGKSGYTRILKSACRARGAEHILGNVLSGAAPPVPAFSINYKVGDGPAQEWSGDGDDESIARVAVFDSHSASVYLTEKTDVAFRPFGLDLFDKLAQASKAVRAKLEREQGNLGPSTVQMLELPENTAAAKLLAGLSSLTEPERVKTLSTLSEAEQERLTLLEKQLVDLQANDPAKVASELKLRAGRFRALAAHLKKLDEALSQEAVKGVFDAQSDTRKKKEEAEKLRENTFPAGLFPGTGSDSWRELWEAARRFSQDDAYPGQPFPVTEEEARCVLCQQDLQQEAVDRLKQFEAFVISAVEKEFRVARETYGDLYKRIDKLKIADQSTEEAVKEIRLESEPLADQLKTSLTAAEDRRAAVLQGLEDKQGLPPGLAEYASLVGEVEALAQQLEQRVQGLQNQAGQGQKEKITAELRELKAREILGKHVDAVVAEIDRKKKIAAYGLCLDDTKTQGITTKSTAVTKVAVTDRLKKSFRDELTNLNFRHVEVELKEAGGEVGNLYHKLILTRAPGVELPKVVSEGEARCLSIAAFFAELSTADDPSAILFDDPVSSLDYKWRENVAARIVTEAKTRQVIVFTHDIVFLLLLRQCAEEQGVQRLDQHVRQLKIGAGVCAEELPWVAMPVKKRIGFLKNEWQSADKRFREGHQNAYEKDASYIYGLLREAWERGLEEVLLEGVVERYRTGVQTQHIHIISDITKEDCTAVEIGMAKCSKWLPGHDQAPAAKQDVPEPAELKADIEALEDWAGAIRKRRK
jgi:energy-coupling factor transporter ATP-binding protein EcfA2